MDQYEIIAEIEFMLSRDKEAEEELRNVETFNLVAEVYLHVWGEFISLLASISYLYLHISLLHVRRSVFLCFLLLHSHQEQGAVHVPL